MKRSFLAITFAFTGCVADYRYLLTVTNNSTANITYVIGYNYPDTSIPPNDGRLISKLVPSESKTYESSEKWESKIDAAPGKKFSYFFFNTDTISKYGWDTIRIHNKILKRIDISAQELKSIGYKIIYE